MPKPRSRDHVASSPFWNRVPEQLRRLPILFVIAIAGLLVARARLVPADFGEHGHYRTAALADVASLEMKYAGHQACADCHEDESDAKRRGYHKGVACEICHGPAAQHIEDPDEAELRLPQGRGFCPLCHEYLPSRPTGFPQILAASHNPMKPCISCHDPHDPIPPETPGECGACHATIARSKAVSSHIYVPCTRCHEASEQHKINPRRFRPSRPDTREFCGGCHARDAAEKGIVTVDMQTHGEQYVCWQCHYPHLPEIR